MVKIEKQKKGSKTYFYLAHNFREGKDIKKKRIYLGDEMPKDIEERKKSFMQEFYKEKYFRNLYSIKKNFNSEYNVMPPSAKEKSKEIFSIKFTYNTQRIEGSTLTLKETAKLLEDGISPSSKSLRDIKEAEAHQKVFFSMLDYKGILNFGTILKWHKDLLKNSKGDIAGRIRNYNVEIAQSKFKPPMHLELDALLGEFFDWYKKNKKIVHPVELAALVHLKFVTIHPFGDGNGRMSRLMMNFVLKDNRFPLLDIPYTKRSGYYNALERSQIHKEDGIFVQWFFRRYLNEYKRYIKKK